MKRSRRASVSATATLVAVAALVPIALAGCGGSESAAAGVSSAPPASITKAELIKKGDAICRNTDKIQDDGIAAYSKQHPNGLKTIAEQEKIMVLIALPPIKVEIRELVRLGAPKGDKAKIEAITNGLGKALKASEKAPFTLLGTKGEGEFGKPDKLAKAYGFVDCAKAL
jgi:hypothetical protein